MLKNNTLGGLNNRHGDPFPTATYLRIPVPSVVCFRPEIIMYYFMVCMTCHCHGQYSTRNGSFLTVSIGKSLLIKTERTCVCLSVCLSSNHLSSTTLFTIIRINIYRAVFKLDEKASP